MKYKNLLKKISHTTTPKGDILNAIGREPDSIKAGTIKLNKKENYYGNKSIS